MRAGEHEVARSYILYREQRAKERAAEQETVPSGIPHLNVMTPYGHTVPLETCRLFAVVEEACAGLDSVSGQKIIDGTIANLYEGVKELEVFQSAVFWRQSFN